jgi:hypothetical protein
MSLRPPVESLVSEVQELRARVASMERRRRWSFGMLGVLVLAVLSSRVSLASGSACSETLPGLLTPFCPDEPAQALVVNQNYRELIRLVETKVGTVSIASGATPGAAGTGSISTASLTTPGALSAGSLSVGPVSATSLSATSVSATSANLQSLTAASETGFVLSCAEASVLNGLQGFPFCCRMNVANGDTTCNLATGSSGASWAASSVGYPGLGATTTGRYSLSCVAGAPGANFPFCCRLNANSGAVQCGQGNTYSLGSTGLANVPF